MLFEKSKLSLSGLLPIARNFVLYEDEYLEAMQVCKERGDDQTLWIERFVRGISLDISSLKNEAIRIEEEKIKKKKKKLLDLNSRQLKVINHLKHNPKIKRKEYVKMMGVSTMTAYRDINELVDRGILECKGGGRSTHYVLNEQNEDNQENEVRKNKVVKVISDPSFDQGPTSSQTQNQTQAQTQTQTQSQAQQSQYPNQYSNDSNSFGDNTSGTPVDSTNNTFASNREDTDYVGNVSGNNYSDEESEDNNPPSGYDNPSQFDDDLDGNVTQGDDDFSGFVNS
jgi:hypothetical protein